MMGYESGCHTGHMGQCGCGCMGMLSIDEEIQALEVHRQHLNLQLEMIEKRISGLRKAGK